MLLVHAGADNYIEAAKVASQEGHSMISTFLHEEMTMILRQKYGQMARM